jgi:hypothetical protein
LKSIPVSIVVLDHSVSPLDFQNYEELLEQAIVSHQNSWKLVATYSICRKGVEHLNAAKMYLSNIPPANPQGVIRIDMSKTLGKVLTLELHHVRNGDSH